MKKLNVFIVPMTNKVIFPYQVMKLRLQEMQHYDSKQFNQYVGFVTVVEQDMDGIKKVQKFSQYGTLVRITGEEYTIYSNNRVFVGLTFARFRIESIIKNSPYYVATVEICTDDILKESELFTNNLIQNLKKEAKNHLEIFSQDQKVIQGIDTERSINKLIYNIASNAELNTLQKLRLLQTDDHSEKITMLTQFLTQRSDEFQVTKGLEEKVKKDMVDSIKTTYVQKKPIEAPFAKLDDVGKLEEKLKGMKLPESAREVAEQELKKLRSMGSQHHESSIIKNYVAFLLSLPWDRVVDETLSIDNAKETLDRDHWGLIKVKDRILQFLAVRQLIKEQESQSKLHDGSGYDAKKSAMGSIICFHGPPGVGKTSLGQSIAQALNRPFFRIALGGVSDEAQIRGHRRTYVGALPGQIITAINKVQCKNPVILLDEVDKVGHNQRGDPSSALLEVLDPEQNSKFVDNYLNLEFDLSQVLFIATANNIDQIQPALKDRLEMIEIPGYTLKEKVQIAITHLVPKQLRKNGLLKEQVDVPEESVAYLIKAYSAEAGVRQLERNISGVFRNVALQLVKNKNNFQKVTVDRECISEILGSEIYSDEMKNPDIMFPGVARGLAWTPYGGKVLMIECVKMIGKGRIEVTGMLGDVMKESVRAALGLIKAYWPQIKQLCKTPEEINFEQTDIHIHFPAGGIPKDGPSAGIAITTALVSLFTGLRVKNNYAMTGEITLTGRVLPVGGIKEKILGAYECGVENVIIPYRNKQNLKDVDQEVKERVNIKLARTIDEVLFMALEGNGPKIKMSTDFGNL